MKYLHSGFEMYNMFNTVDNYVSLEEFRVAFNHVGLLSPMLISVLCRCYLRGSGWDRTIGAALSCCA